MPIRLAILDDHLLMVNSMERMLNASGDIEVSGTYTSGDALIKGIKENIPDILLLDYHLPDENGGQIARYLTYHYPQVKIVALTGFDQPGLAMEMLEAGCKGYLLKTTAHVDTIVDAVKKVSEGYLFLDNSISHKYTSAIRSSEEQKKEEKPKLTNRELEVLHAIATELSSQEIADKLCISKRTVDNHRSSLMIKSGAKNTVGLIKFAIELKLI